VGWLVFGWSRPAFPDEQRHLQLAPIEFATRVGGDIGYTYLSNHFGTSRTAMQMLGVQVTANARARSYFWQPWFAQVSGDLSVGVNSSTTSYGPPPATSKSANMAVTGQAALDMLKYSRFPFKAHVFQGENHASGSSSGINSDYKNSGFDLTQQYRSLRGDVDSLAFYTHSTGGRASFGTEEVRDQLNLTLTAQPVKYQSLHVIGAFSDISHPPKGDRLLTDTLMTNHLYQPNSSFSVASLVNLIKTDYTLNSGISAPQQSDYNSQQLSSFASWRPNGNPLTMTSSVRLLRSKISSDSTTPLRFDDSNFNLGANYAWSRLLRMYGSVNVNDDNSGIQTVSTNAALAAQKFFGENPDAINLGGFRYTRFAGASLSNSTTTRTSSSQTATTSTPNQTATSSVQSLGGNLGHQLSKSTSLGSGSLTIDLNQRLSEVLSTRSTPVSNLISGGSLSWNRSKGMEVTIFRLRATDSRTLTGRQSFFQLINLQASRNVRLLRHQSLTGNLTIQTSRSGDSEISTPFITTPSADLYYTNERLFAVKNLTFTSTLQITGAEIVSSQNSTDLFSTGNTARAAWDNNLNYFIGKLKLRLYSHIAEANKVSQSSLLFSINRAF
jgi:hypothetical protein